MPWNTNKAICPGTGLAAVDVTRPPTGSRNGVCPTCGNTYSVKLDNGIMKHVVREPQLRLETVDTQDIVAAAKKAMAKAPTVPVSSQPRTSAEIATSPNASKAWVGRLQKEQGLHERRISYLEKRLDEAAKQFARIDKPWWKRW